MSSFLRKCWEDDLLAFAMVLTFILPVFPAYVYFQERNWNHFDAGLNSFIAVFCFWFVLYLVYLVVSKRLGSGSEESFEE